MVDLHTHSTFSDGTFAPEALVAEAARLRLAGVALTDHDTVDGNPSFLHAAGTHGVRAIAGVEISAEFTHPEQRTGRDSELHILGYFPRWSAGTAAMTAPLADIRRNREERNPQIIRKLQELGHDITYDEVRAVAGNDVVGRPHIAAVMVRKGIVREAQEAFTRFLGTNAPAYVPKRIFTPEKAIGVIRDAGGVPVLAHPKLLSISSEQALRALVRSLVAHGLRGIEAYYPVHDPRSTELFRRIAADHALIVTGGTDFHGANKPDIRLGSGFGGMRTPDECFDNLVRAVSN